MILLWVLLLTVALLGCTGKVDTPVIQLGNTRWEHLRDQMVQQQLVAPGRGITNQLVVKAMRDVPRHEFVPSSHQSRAYEDHPLPIGHGQTISQPYVVAFMTEQLNLQSADRVLEIGTGSGYQAAVLSRLAAEVYSIEIIDALTQMAAENLKRIGCTNVWLKSGDGYLGWPEHAPYDAIIVTCAPTQVPRPLLEQLKSGGRMIIPVGERSEQMLYVFEKRGEHLEKQAVLPVRFVPMTGRIQEIPNP